MFGLDPQSIAARVKATARPPQVPTLGESLLRGMIGFTLVSLGGFAPWVLAGRWFYRNVGEVGLYVVCAIVFIGLSGGLLHRLILGPGSLVRCYKLFSLAFVAYAIAWTIGWMAFRGVTGSVVGAVAGSAAMSGMIAWGFGACRATLKIFLVLLVTHAAGYFLGEWTHNFVMALKEGGATGLMSNPSTRSLVSKFMWGLCYGLGFGAGIGLAFHFGQAKARELITTAAQHEATAAD